MKRMLLSVFALMIMFSTKYVFASVEITDNRTAEKNAQFDSSEFEVRDYLYNSPYGSTTEFVIVKNNSQATVTVLVDAIAYDVTGSVLGTGQAEISCLGPNEESVAPVLFYGVNGIDNVEYELNYNKSNYDAVLSDISANASINGENVTLVVTNNGDKSAQFLEGYVLFLDTNGKVVSYDSHYIVDDDSELKPGASMSSQFNCSEIFDNIDCFFTGRSDGKSATVENEVSDEDFEIQEYYYDSGSGSKGYYLVIKNNSDKNVSISGNATAIGHTGNVVGAANCNVDAIGPGETSLAYFWFSNIGDDFDHVDYKLNYNTKGYYQSIISDLFAQASVNNNNVVVMVTNNGSEPAMFVQAYVLFLDSSNNLVDVESNYVVDNDSEIKPGDTISAQLNTYQDFDHVLIYFTGRRNA